MEVDVTLSPKLPDHLQPDYQGMRILWCFGLLDAYNGCLVKILLRIWKKSTLLVFLSSISGGYNTDGGIYERLCAGQNPHLG